MAQLVKNPPAMQETRVRSLGWEDPLEKGKGYLLQYSGLENSRDCIVHGVTKSQTQLSDFHFHNSAEGLPRWPSGKNLPANERDEGDPSLIPGWGRSPGGGNGNPLQYSCLENPKERGAWWATFHRIAKSQT